MSKELRMSSSGPSSGQKHAVAGLAFFKKERYGDAAKEYRAAIKAGGSTDEINEWDKMAALSEANATAEIQTHVPEPSYPTKKELLSWPTVPPGAIPDPPEPPPGRCCRCCFKRLRLCLGNRLGVLVTIAMNCVINVVGRVFGYRAEIWTDWYRHKWVVGVLLLAYIRERLSAENLKSTYPIGELVAFLTAGPKPPPGVKYFRTADGSWNNLDNPKEGAANTRFLRNVEYSA